MIWRYFARLFEVTYFSSYPWDGTGVSWPRHRHQYIGDCAPWDGTHMPRAEDNAAALARIVELARGDATEALVRMERLFRDRRVVSIGISLPFVAHWFEAAATKRVLQATARRVLAQGGGQ